MKTENYDEAFDRGEEDITQYLDLSTAKRPSLEQRSVHVDFPIWMVKSLDDEAKRLGITRQSLIKVWIAQKLAQQ